MGTVIFIIITYIIVLILIESIFYKINNRRLKMAQKKKVECYCYLFGTEHMVENRRKIVPKGIMPVYKTKEAACADIAVPDEVIIPAESVTLHLSKRSLKDIKLLCIHVAHYLLKKV